MAAAAAAAPRPISGEISPHRTARRAGSERDSALFGAVRLRAAIQSSGATFRVARAPPAPGAAQAPSRSPQADGGTAAPPPPRGAGPAVAPDVAPQKRGETRDISAAPAALECPDKHGGSFCGRPLLRAGALGITMTTIVLDPATRIMGHLRLGTFTGRAERRRGSRAREPSFRVPCGTGRGRFRQHRVAKPFRDFCATEGRRP
jgi:hypothetical protein